jgi:hypothetical protein
MQIKSPQSGPRELQFEEALPKKKNPDESGNLSVCLSMTG